MNAQIRAYGGWRERRGYGVGALSGTQTMLGLGAVLLALLTILVMPAALPVVAVPLGLFVFFIAIRIRGETLAALLLRHGRWVSARRTGATTYSALDTPELPGVLANLSILEMAGLAVVSDEKRRTVTAVVRVEPQGVGFMDAADVDEWIGGWGAWLAHLGYIPDLAHIQVTVHTSAEPAPAAPTGVDDTLVGQVMQQLREVSVARNVSRTQVSVTVRVVSSREHACARLQDVLASMDSLNRCGMTVLDPLQTPDLSHWIRTCFDPSDRHGPGGTLVDARPTAAREAWDTYQHDSGCSAAFTWDECPGETMPASALNRLLGPAPYVKRVTLVYEPVPAHVAAHEVDKQTQAAAFRSQYRRRLGRDETARERLDVQRAHQTATEQASGSGLVDVGLYAVATAATTEALQTAAADMLNRAGESRIRLRRAYGSQAQCFAVTLGLGFLPQRRF